MIQLAESRHLRIAIIGDIVALIVLTIVGFASHDTLGETTRLIVTTLGALAGWALIAPWFGAFSTDVLTKPAHVWRIALAWIVTAPFALFLRGWILGIEVSTTFILTTIAINGLALILWRAVLAIYVGRSAD
ncbi:MAG: DUF3054 domain-containing protein [Actinomycetota bacterium]